MVAHSILRLFRRDTRKWSDDYITRTRCRIQQNKTIAVSKEYETISHGSNLDTINYAPPRTQSVRILVKIDYVIL